ncbi:MAG TPA: type II toxin-antitoxin system HicB family antitoxin [Hyphomicrobiales bacterium]|nr:type II toxin-antitoxin system HicB family antitoxin [Hyphomicrobiales bacterium]
MLLFPAHLVPDDNGTIFATCPVLPEVKTFGETRDDALEHLSDAIEEALGARMAHNEELPEAMTAESWDGTSPLAKISTLATIKYMLYRALQQAGITRAELARRLNWHREQVDRLFRIDHATRLDQFDAAFAALGREMSIELRKAA